MWNWFVALGLNEADLVMILLAPLCGLMGSVVRVLMLRNSEALPTYPSNRQAFSWRFVYARTNWYFAWSVIGLGSGLLIALLFIGTLAPGAGAAARVLALALLAGYSAPSLWKNQEETVNTLVRDRLRSAQAPMLDGTVSQPAVTVERA